MNPTQSTTAEIGAAEPGLCVLDAAQVVLDGNPALATRLDAVAEAARAHAATTPSP